MSWFNDTTTWPPDRTFDAFCRWFDYQHRSMLVDLRDEPLIRERDRLETSTTQFLANDNFVSKP